VAEAKKRPTLIPVDENFVPPENPTPGEKYQGDLAAQRREGRRLQKVEQVKAVTALQNEIAGIKSAHVDELNRSGDVLRRLGHRIGVLHGIFIGIVVTVVLATGTWLFLLKDIVITNAAAQRMPLPGDGVPEIVDREQRDAPYQRNPREPANAGP
jgi:tetrahydromethanopterin S-methyltransferase subunit G